MKSFFPKPTFKVDDIISYSELVAAENANVQKGMNFQIKPEYSIFLMSVRKNAPYEDVWDEKTNTLIYEGHDAFSNWVENPKEAHQPFTTPNGTLTENGKFFTAAQAYKMKLTEHPHKVKVYEKIKDGIWCYKGFFSLIDAKIIFDGVRNVFKFYLQPVEMKAFNKEIVLPHNRLIPTSVKVEVWARDKGRCVKCGSTENLHFDHDLPFSKGGTSLTAANVRI
ncbi:MAG: HNH endonuclease, partial [Ignavibacterium sp.]